MSDHLFRVFVDELSPPEQRITSGPLWVSDPEDPRTAFQQGNFSPVAMLICKDIGF